MQKVFILSGVFLLMCMETTAQNTARTLSRDDFKDRPQASIDQVSWLAGNWKGPAFNGWGEEVWSSPAGGAMMGMYRSIRADTVWFYELFSIREEEGSLVLNLKHFYPDLRGWEEKDEMVRFPLVKIDGDTVWFSGLTYQRIDDDHMTIYLRLKRGGKITEEVFRMERIK